MRIKENNLSRMILDRGHKAKEWNKTRCMMVSSLTLLVASEYLGIMSSTSYRDWTE